MDKNQAKTKKETLALNGLPEREFILHELKKLIPTRKVMQKVFYAITLIGTFSYLFYIVRHFNLSSTVYFVVIPYLVVLFGTVIKLEQRIISLEKQIKQSSSQSET